ncbi:VOC family protein [Amycolatopsis sp. H20-H5]|uniref:VOC family protein n=1 Tax=Amycolatopsis sp. H20-H5 TaxID=3046309 RepID=UPI002DBB6C28|nr:VOC family protein [Amycolatopsis sp. H20-H5]MEC3974031.1 VOC family protein [Amycolatopsis sp. H20-H5]
MTTHLMNLVVDAAVPRRLEDFWTALLGRPVEQPELAFAPVSVEKEVKNRIHLDLASTSPKQQAELVERALSLGARPAEIGQGTTPWVVLADPEGNEFCVLEPRAQYERAGAVASIVVDAHDPALLAGFWSAATGWEVGVEEAEIVGLCGPSGRGTWLEFLRNEDVKRVKNRLCLEVAPAAGEDPADEVRRLRAAGATLLEPPGEHLTRWALADPEGNEFVVREAGPRR